MKTKTTGFQLPITTELGEFVAHYSDRGLVALDFPGAARTNAAAPSNVPPPVHEWHGRTAAALNNVLAGKAPEKLPPFDWSGATEFQRQVWIALKNIPPGQTQSYGDVARAVGRPNATRAVGSACGANPIPVLIPCHRVLAAHRRIGGFSAGLDRKRTLLQREGVSVSG